MSSAQSPSAITALYSDATCSSSSSQIFVKLSISPSPYTYRPDRSYSSIVTIRKAMLEDAIENDRAIMAIRSDDKAKYVDRITLKY